MSLLQCLFAQMNDGDEFVRQVLEDEAAYYNGGFEDRHDDDHAGIKDPYSEEEARLYAEAHQKAEEERIANERAEQIRLQLEAEFEADLARMNEEQRKAAKRQKRKDARIVRRLLKAAKNKRYYRVLGIRNWDIHLGPLSLLRTDAQTIRRAYRSRSKLVHPDKNRDGRAQEAFYAVENAASILGDEQQRSLYDEEVRLVRQRKRDEMKQNVKMVTDVIGTNVGRVIWLFRRILGHFAAPILVLGCLLV
jgi:DnaJ domain